MIKKRTFTLIEIVIVILLITLITGALGYNMRGTLEKGKAFRTEQAQKQLYDLLMLCVESGDTLEQVRENPIECLNRMGLARNPEKLVQDGWGLPFQIEITRRKDLRITSQTLKRYQERTRS